MYVRSFVRSFVRLSVCLMKSVLELTIIFLFQVSLRSVSGQSQVSLRLSDQSQVSLRSVLGQS